MEKPHKNLEAWKQSMDLVIEIYKMTKEFPSQEIYGITSQVKRAAASVPSNIAEGAARQTKKKLPIFFILPKAHSVSWTLRSRSPAALDSLMANCGKVSTKEWSRSTK